MTITKIYYEQLFPTGQYANIRMGVEIQLDPTDSAMDHQITSTFEYAKKLVNDSFKALNPDLSPHEYGTERAEWVDHSTLKSPQQARISAIDSFIADIQNCTALSEENSLGVQVGLLSYEHLCSKDPRIAEAYNKKLEELS